MNVNLTTVDPVRSYIKRDTGELIRAIPTFSMRATYDSGDRLTELPESVYLSPDFYRLITRILPGLAAAKNESVHYTGSVISDKSDIVPAGYYAYYGYSRPHGRIGPAEPRGIELLGYGKSAFPSSQRFGSLNGKPNFVHSEKLDKPLTLKESIINNKRKSDILTNILNDSLDFNPLFGPKYVFEDVEYDPANDPDKKGPRPTDHWVPKQVNGVPVLREDGTQVYMPVPYTMELPIYNFKHPMWEKDPEAAWALVTDVNSPDEWATWGTAPSHATYDGTTRMTEGGKYGMSELSPIDYYKVNMRFANKPGYFEGFENIKDLAHRRAAERTYLGSRKSEIAKLKKQEEATRQQIQAQRYLTPEDTRRSTIGYQSDYYRKLIHDSLMRNQPDLRPYIDADPELSAIFRNGVTRDLEKNIKHFYGRYGSFEKYNSVSDPAIKMVLLLRDYADYIRSATRNHE